MQGSIDIELGRGRMKPFELDKRNSIIVIGITITMFLFLFFILCGRDEMVDLCGCIQELEEVNGGR